MTICILSLSCCDKFTESKEARNLQERHNQEQEAKETQKIINEMNERSYREEATLLAIKYKIDEDKVFNLLTATQSLDLQNFQASFEGKFTTKARLNSLAEKYNIPIGLIANLLIDYYSMQACEPGE